MPKDVEVIQTYINGWWGEHEYSRHPQWYKEEMTHIACIPRGPSQPEVPDILFAPLRMDQHWAEDLSVVVRGFSLIIESVRKELSVAAAITIKHTLVIVFKEESVCCYARFLIMLLRQVIDRMNYLPAVAT